MAQHSDNKFSQCFQQTTDPSKYNNVNHHYKSHESNIYDENEKNDTVIRIPQPGIDYFSAEKIGPEDTKPSSGEPFPPLNESPEFFPWYIEKHAKQFGPETDKNAIEKEDGRQTKPPTPESDNDDDDDVWYYEDEDGNTKIVKPGYDEKQTVESPEFHKGNEVEKESIETKTPMPQLDENDESYMEKREVPHTPELDQDNKENQKVQKSEPKQENENIEEGKTNDPTMNFLKYCQETNISDVCTIS